MHAPHIIIYIGRRLSRNARLAALFLCMAAGLQLTTMAQQTNYNMELTKQLEIFNAVCYELHLNYVDSLSIYNAGLTALECGNMERAKSFYNKAFDIKYYAKGDTYAKLGAIALVPKDTVSAKKFFEDGFSSFPNSQVLCVSLINLYLSTGENPDKLFSLLDKAKANDPKNASLYYVEGNIRKDLGQFDEAVAAYRKSIEVDPSYEYGYIGEGLIYTNKADEYAKAANTENDDAKYEKLVEQFNTTLKASIEPFEKAFEVAKATDLKVNIAEQLKQTCYRFSDDPAYKAKYDSYKAFIEANRK